ncbi:cytochrome bc complex cytochrome b subunit [Nocardia otitidiscaviarum]|uniref:Cytochrome bc1 complex cytochrome b subunit n=1 Tax=Nocardia otitidiscaviarum TaxID=1823 RepID=A0A516NV04_9NOCA|nr:cytochrome bc complex cytochrome b subunit [Nocardia otitidiscaviarum]MCP9622165.1 cytochrome bc complex cytochrome b subunit [Nocardia otitidiscaviarum]QDP82737.1 cytochrome bc complex cytochrome b subunit [Nocardia otitidiscaviarum]
MSAVVRGVDGADERYQAAAFVKRSINKVFPTHWSFLLGEIALYTFIILLLSGVYLTLFFDPSMSEVVYDGVYQPLRGVTMSRAYESTLHISFEVRGGLFVRQLHHWSALLFVASMIVHMCRIFFTGAFRRPREITWVIGCLLLIIAMFEGFFGYSLPDDLLSGTGLRAAFSGITMSVPIVGTWLHWMLFDGDFPGTITIPRLYITHVLLFPAIMVALVIAHIGIVWYQKHTQFPGPARTENNVVGTRIVPVFSLDQSAFFMFTLATVSLLGGLLQINPVWNLGPYNPAQVAAGSQPDFYMMWADGMLRLMPPWEIYLGRYTIPGAFWVAAAMGIVFALLVAYPWIEKRLSNDTAHHNLLQRPRDVPVRTAIGAMALTFYLVVTLACANDVIALTFDISLNATTWFFRFAALLAPPLAYYASYRLCLGLQRSDRAVLAHGIETGMITRLPHGEYLELHQPLGPSDDHGRPVPLAYEGAPVPKKMNRLGAAGRPGSGSFLRPDPASEAELLVAIDHEEERRQLTVLRDNQRRRVGEAGDR